MKNGIGGALILSLVLLTPAAMAAVTVRNVHNTVYDTFVPQETDIQAEAGSTSEFIVGGDTSDEFENALWRSNGANGQVLAATPAAYTCGVSDDKLELNLQNHFPIHVPNRDSVDDVDNQAKNHGVIRADGSFYVIPEFDGTLSDEVEGVWFEFFENVPTAPGQAVGPDDICDATGDATASAGSAAGVNVGAGTAGAYTPFYRGDTTPEDGWLIPVNTFLVPDNVYAGVLRAYVSPDALEDSPAGSLAEATPGTSDGLVLAKTAFVYAIVDNMDGQNDDQYSNCQPEVTAPNDQTRCGDDDIRRDLTPPWPVVVPGDVSVETAREGASTTTDVTVEYGEHIDIGTIDVKIDYADQSGVTDVAEPTQQPADGDHQRDVDSVPVFTTETTAYGHMVDVSLGDAVEAGDTVIVSATDLSGNSATKTATIPAN